MTAVRRELYYNEKQKQFLGARQKTRVLIGGRGFGKSHVLGLSQFAKAGAMPRSKGILASTTYSQLLTKTWPAIAASWESCGLREGVHYVMGVQPPKHFKRALSPPKRFGNVITLMNGRTVDLLSMDRPELARGGSYDDADIDEAALLKHEHWSRIILPSIRGNRHRFAHTHWHQEVGFFTSLPWKASGYWILDYEEKAKAKPDDYFYLEANAYDNIHILGEKGIERMREELTYLEFQIEVMNERTLKVEDAFYHAYDPEKHEYQPGYLYGEDKAGRDAVTGRKDVDPKSLLDLSFDFSGWFNCMTVYQERPGLEERMVDSFHVKGDQKLSALVKNFCEAYRSHRFKYVRLWGEPRGHDKNPTAGTIYQQLVRLFAAQGWKAEIMAPAGQSGKHTERNHYMGSIMMEETRGYPHLRISCDACKDVIIALRSAQTLPDGRKDKSKEKERSFPQEHATHYTDTVDYYFEQKWARRVGQGLIGRGGTVDFF